ncbi:MAG: NAD-dependent epimerase/dehydratase family protein [Bryobacteraceae bacterium]
MKPILVTGATGFIGWHVARHLLERGDPVRILAREPGRVRDLPGVETREGDLCDPASIAAAVEGCGVVFHVAADYRLWAANPDEIYRSNHEGTRNLLTASRRAAVDRFVYTSTVGCIGIPEQGVGDEGTPVGFDDMSGAYKRSKYLAEQEALRFAEQGFPVIIVNPTAPVGDHDFKPTPTGQIILDYLKGGMPAFVDTGLNVVDVRDTARGHLLACDQGRPGERYILGAENLTLAQIFAKLETISGIPAPKTQIPYSVAFAAGLVSTGWARLTGNPPRAPLDGVRMARKKMFVTPAKAVKELGFTATPVEGALRRAVEWFRGNGYC